MGFGTLFHLRNKSDIYQEYVRQYQCPVALSNVYKLCGRITLSSQDIQGRWVQMVCWRKPWLMEAWTRVATRSTQNSPYHNYSHFILEPNANFCQYSSHYIKF